MNNIIRNKLSMKIVITLLVSTFSLSAQADTFKINFSKVVAYDDGDYKPDGAGEISFNISVNGKMVYKTKKRISLDDRGADTFHLNFSEKISVGDNQNVTIRMSGDEYDKYSRNEKCSGQSIVNRNRLGDQKLDCGESNGELGLNLEYHVERIK